MFLSLDGESVSDVCPGACMGSWKPGRLQVAQGPCVPCAVLRSDAVPMGPHQTS